MAATNGGTVLLGTLGGIAGATAMFYGLTVAQPFGAYTPPDQNEAWQVKSEDRMIEGKWVRCSLSHCTAGLINVIATVMIIPPFHVSLCAEK